LKKEILIERFPENPILTPADVGWVRKNYPKKDWGVLNCGVIFDKKDSHYKMLFRAGAGAFADIGLAVSEDGVNWQAKEKPVLKHSDNNFWYCRRGIEDPRIVKWIDGYYYVFATACSEPDPVTKVTGRIGIWRTRNFLDFEWIAVAFEWEDKNASIFPEPINGWAYLIHRKFPHMWISRTRDLTLRSGWQDTQVLIEKDRFYRSPTTGNLPHKIGLAGPPIKTPKGWLVVTHVVHGKGENRFNRVYSLGFMVLDLQNPTKIKDVHPAPILWPTEKYEMMGCVPVVCFSGATVDLGGDALYIYYAGADTVICGGRLYKKDLPMCY